MGLNELSGGQLLAIDDVSFTKEPCKQIPWNQNKGRHGTFFNESVSQRFVTGAVASWLVRSLRSERFGFVP